MIRFIFFPVLSLVTLGEFFSNNYNYTIIVVQPVSVDNYHNSQDSENTLSSNGEGKGINITFCSCFANDLQYAFFERWYLVKINIRKCLWKYH